MIPTQALEALPQHVDECEVDRVDAERQLYESAENSGLGNG